MTAPEVAAAIRRAAKARGATDIVADSLAGALDPGVFLDGDDIDHGKIDLLLDAVPGLRPATHVQTGREAHRARHPDASTSAMDAGATAYRNRRQGRTRKADDETSTTADSSTDQADLGQGNRGSSAPTGIAVGRTAYAERHGRKSTG